MVGRGYNDVFRHVGIEVPAVPTASILAGTESACPPSKLGGVLSDVVSMTGNAKKSNPWFIAFLMLMVLQSPLLNTRSTNPPPNFGGAMTWYVPKMGIQQLTYARF